MPTAKGNNYGKLMKKKRLFCNTNRFLYIFLQKNKELFTIKSK